jgi:tRNA(Ile)-lysidine synthase
MAASKAITAAEAKALFAGLETVPVLVLAVSGGPDSMALMVLAARWRGRLRNMPKLIAVTIDHGLRREAKAEARRVAALARALKVPHRIVRWTGKKPDTGLQQAARLVRYRLLADAARQAGAAHILTAHTCDDQAETVLIRMMRGSGISGLGAMQKVSPVPGAGDVQLLRPLLAVAKSRLIATLKAASIAFAEDPSNRDPRFTRARLRALMPILAAEGLDTARLSLLADRLKRADRAIEAVVDRAMALFAPEPGDTTRSRAGIDAAAYQGLPDEIALRLIGRAVAQFGDEGPVELAKLEALKRSLDDALKASKKPGKIKFRRSLAGALVSLADGWITVERAPARRGASLTKRRKPAPSR